METRNVLFEKKYLNIIFDNRNKEYGAYQLRMEYEKNIAIALFSSILLLVIVPAVSYTHLDVYKRQI